MRIRLAGLCLALVAAATTAAVADGRSAASRESAVIASITDGDTLRLSDGRRVRLLQIDTPEIGTGECYSRASRTALLALAPVGARIDLEVDARLDRVDRYGRLLRYVVRGATNVNVELVRRGAAAPYFYRSERGRYAGTLMSAATAARARKLGLWGACPGTALAPDRQVDTGRSGPKGNPVGGGATGGNCHPSYEGACLDPNASDYDCAGGEGNGPKYVQGPIRVVGPDEFDLDRDGNGIACEP